MQTDWAVCFNCSVFHRGGSFSLQHSCYNAARLTFKPFQHYQAKELSSLSAQHPDNDTCYVGDKDEEGIKHSAWWSLGDGALLHDRLSPPLPLQCPHLRMVGESSVEVHPPGRLLTAKFGLHTDALKVGVQPGFRSLRHCGPTCHLPPTEEDDLEVVVKWVTGSDHLLFISLRKPKHNVSLQVKYLLLIKHDAWTHGWEEFPPPICHLILKNKAHWHRYISWSQIFLWKWNAFYSTEPPAIGRAICTNAKLIKPPFLREQRDGESIDGSRDVLSPTQERLYNHNKWLYSHWLHNTSERMLTLSHNVELLFHSQVSSRQ